MRGWTARVVGSRGGGAALAAALIGIATGITQAQFYHRMTAVNWWGYPAWVVQSSFITLA